MSIFRRNQGDPRLKPGYLRAKEKTRASDSERKRNPPTPRKIAEGRERAMRLNGTHELVIVIMTGNDQERRAARKVLNEQLGSSRKAARHIESAYLAAGARPKLTDPRRWLGW